MCVLGELRDASNLQVVELFSVSAHYFRNHFVCSNVFGWRKFKQTSAKVFLIPPRRKMTRMRVLQIVCSIYAVCGKAHTNIKQECIFNAISCIVESQSFHILKLYYRPKPQDAHFLSKVRQKFIANVPFTSE